VFIWVCVGVFVCFSVWLSGVWWLIRLRASRCRGKSSCCWLHLCRHYWHCYQLVRWMAPC